MRRFINRMGCDATEVLSYRERIESGGYCDTCSYTECITDIVYRQNEPHNSEGVYTYYGSFGNLIKELERY